MLHEQQKWEVTCPWNDYSVWWTSDAGFISAAFRKWLRAYGFNVGNVCRSLRSVQINAFEGCHFTKTESHKPPEETNPVLGWLYANVIFDSYLLAALTCILLQGVSLLAMLNKQKRFHIVKSLITVIQVQSVTWGRSESSYRCAKHYSELEFDFTW